MTRTKLSDSEIQSRLATIPGWEFDGSAISRQFEFKSYAAGVMFAAAAGQLADHMDHHPDLLIGYQKVRVSLNTHDAGGITDYDFALASQINALV
jgi:4a-hydroxytetrahydrobiopterin dehydratase